MPRARVRPPLRALPMRCSVAFLPLNPARLESPPREQMMKLYPAGYGLSAIVGHTESQVARSFGRSVPMRIPFSWEYQRAAANCYSRVERRDGSSLIRSSRSRCEADRASARSIPSHCPLLQPVADMLRKEFAKVKLGTARMVYVGNINARALRAKEPIAFDLANNIAHGVPWYDATTALAEKLLRKEGSDAFWCSFAMWPFPRPAAGGVVWPK